MSLVEVHKMVTCLTEFDGFWILSTHFAQVLNPIWNYISEMNILDNLRKQSIRYRHRVIRKLSIASWYSYLCYFFFFNRFRIDGFEGWWSLFIYLFKFLCFTHFFTRVVFIWPQKCLLCCLPCLIAIILFWRIGGALAYICTQFWDFSKIFSFPKILSLKSFGDSLGSRYIQFMMIII